MRRVEEYDGGAGIEELIRLTRGGDDTTLGRLLDRYREYLGLVARSLIGPALRARRPVGPGAGHVP